ncbi:DsbA family protein [Candidatus Woesearchaeota archaeon]|nr:DsbA family protein [Candidatus Woesearchaeota archaeon]
MKETEQTVASAQQPQKAPVVEVKKHKKPLIMVKKQGGVSMKEEKGSCCQEPKQGKQDFTMYLLAFQAFLLLILVIQVGSLAKSLSGVTGNAAQDSGDTVVAAPSPTPAAPTVNKDMKVLMDDDAVKGDKNAPVTIVEWSDFECPFCGRFYQQTLPSINEKYIKTGKVKLVYRDFPLEFHAQAQKAAEAAECAGEQNKYWEMHDKLFEKGVSGGVSSFKQYAKDLGLDTKKFDDCLDTGKMAGEIEKDLQDGAAVGIRGTPGFVVNGQLVSGAQPFSAFEQVIEAALKQ